MADEEATEVAEEGDSGAASATKAKKGKAPKAPKAPKGGADAGDDEPKGKDKKKKGPKVKSEKKGGAGGIIIIMLLVLVILVGGLGAAMYFDMFSARTIVGEFVTEPMLDVIIWLDPQFNSIRQRLRAEEEAQIKRLEERAEDFDIREEDILFRETVLDSREQLLDRRENDLDRREDQIYAMYERTIPIHRREMTEEEMEDMLSLSRTYTQMAPDRAAEILVRLYDPRDVAAILYFMGERNAAAIMTEMSTEYAAEITEILLYS